MVVRTCVRKAFSRTAIPSDVNRLPQLSSTAGPVTAPTGVTGVKRIELARIAMLIAASEQYLCVFILQSPFFTVFCDRGLVLLVAINFRFHLKKRKSPLKTVTPSQSSLPDKICGGDIIRSI